MYEQAVKEGVDPNNIQEIQAYIAMKQQGGLAKKDSTEDHSTTQIQSDEPQNTEELAKVLEQNAEEDKKANEDEVEPKTPEETKAFLQALAEKKDPKKAILSVKAKTSTKKATKPVAAKKATAKPAAKKTQAKKVVAKPKPVEKVE